MTPEERRRIDDTAQRVQWHLDEIERLFKPGVKITLLVRTPSHPDGGRDFLMTNDRVGDAIAAIRRRILAGEDAIRERPI